MLWTFGFLYKFISFENACWIAHETSSLYRNAEVHNFHQFWFTAIQVKPFPVGFVRSPNSLFYKPQVSNWL